MVANACVNEELSIQAQKESCALSPKKLMKKCLLTEEDCTVQY